ncbi:MAG: hypothetical protein KBT31_06380, partial [Firmicutes bacterium]|nr:hypothetical protein [Candidatus Colimorpha enterica]
SVKGATNTPFYLRWWFILIIALFNLTLPAIILTCMTDWKVWVKVIVVFALLLPIILSIFIYPLIEPFLFDYLEKYYGDMYPPDGYPQDQITENASQNQYVDFDCLYEIRCDLL